VGGRFPPPSRSFGRQGEFLPFSGFRPFDPFFSLFFFQGRIEGICYVEPPPLQIDPEGGIVQSRKAEYYPSFFFLPPWWEAKGLDVFFPFFLVGRSVGIGSSFRNVAARDRILRGPLLSFFPWARGPQLFFLSFFSLRFKPKQGL